jgi:hypothetical protein
MFNHGAGQTNDAAATALRQHLLDSKLRDVDVAPQIRSGQLFEILCRVFQKRFCDENPALLTTPSIEPKVSIAAEAISRAVEGSPMSPRTTANRSVAANVDAVIFSELPTTL